MQTIKIDKGSPSKDILNIAAKTLKTGGIIVYPTDTAYGLGANALDIVAIKKVYRLMNRNPKKPTHVIVKDWKMIKKLSFTNKLSKKVYDNFFPGPVTMILKKRDIVSDVLTGGLPTIGVRISDDLITQSLSNLIPFPYTTSSANRSGEQTPYSVDHVRKVLEIDKVDLVLDAGKLSKKSPSTLIELSKDSPEILREGPVSKADIEKVLGLTIN